MLVPGLDRRHLNSNGRAELPRLSGQIDIDRRFADQPDDDARFLLNLPPGGIIGKLIWLNVSTGREPAIQANVVVQQYPPVMRDEHGHGEIAR